MYTSSSSLTRDRMLIALVMSLSLFALANPAEARQAPDLEAVAVQGPDNAMPGDKVQVHRTVKATGNFDGFFDYEIRLSTNSIISGSDTLVYSFNGTSGLDGPIGATIPSTMAHGAYYWGLIVKPEPGESDLGDNWLAGNKITLGPMPVDLKASAISGPASAKQGDVVNVSRKIESIGGAFDGKFDYEVRLSTNTVISGGDTLVYSFAGATSLDTSIPMTVPASLPDGDYYWGIFVLVEPGETETANNYLAGNKIKVAAAAAPDLEAISVAGPAAAAPGDKVKVNRKVASVGGPFDGHFSYEIRLSTSSTITAGDTLAFSAGSSTMDFTVDVTIPANLADGTWYWGLIVISESGESNTANNTVAGNKITVTSAPLPPDIKAISFVGPSTVMIGESKAVTMAAKNDGGPLSGQLEYGVYLSDNANITAGDFLLGKYKTDLSSQTWSQQLPPMPANVAPGSYFWGFILDKAPGEATSSDNDMLGNQVVVKAKPAQPDLCLASTNAIVMSMKAGGAAPTASIQVQNCGDTASVLNWSAQSPSFVGLSPSSGSLTAGATQMVQVKFKSGLAIGTYQSTLQIKNAQNASDSESVAIKLIVGIETFQAGETLTGLFDSLGNHRVMAFWGSHGKFVLKAKALGPGMKMRVSILRPNGSLLATKVLKKKKKAGFKLDTSGQHRLVLEPMSAAGSYILKTKLKVKKSQSKLLTDSEGSRQTLDVTLPPLSRLDVSATANHRFRGDGLSLELFDAAGSLVHRQIVAGPNAEISDLEILDGGEYRLVVDGIVGRKAVELHIDVASEVADEE